MTTHTQAQVEQKINLAQATYLKWSKTPLTTRAKLLSNVANLLRAKQDELALIMTREMGKLVRDGVVEIQKCATVLEYYANNASSLLAPTMIKTEAKESYVRYDPLGVTLAIMPWNFPFWQVFRAASPALLAGNTMLLKHASNVPESALMIQSLFEEAGSPAGVFQTLLIPGNQVASVIAHPSVRKVAITGSEEAGVSVAIEAGRHLKSSVLELGGSDAFVVFADADITASAAAAATARLIVAGQSCIAAKRFIVHESIYPQFMAEFTDQLRAKKLGDPTDPTSDVGPLVNEAAVTLIHSQVSQSIEMGAEIALGGEPSPLGPTYYPPTILTGVTPDMPVWVEETFGPVAAVTTFSTIEQAVSLANHPHFGLGLSIWTNDKQVIETMTQESETGCVFVNSIVKSDPRLPFGGTKYSGFGRELAREGLLEYTNIKTVWIN